MSIKVRLIDNYIHRRDETDARELPFEGKTIGELAPRGACVCVWGDRVHRIGEESWARAVPNDGAVLVYARTEGGKGFKNTLRTILSVIPGNIFNVLNPLASIELIATGQSSLLVTQAFRNLFPGPPGFHLDKASGGDSATYGFGGVRTLAREGALVPVVYGKHLIGGVVAQQYRYAFADNTKQRLNVSLILSHGPIQSIAGQTSDGKGNSFQGNLPTDGIWLNDVPISNLRDAYFTWRLGSDPQTPTHAGNVFGDIGVEYPVGEDIKEETFVIYRTRTAIDRLLVNITFPNGLGAIKDSDASQIFRNIDFQLILQDEYENTLLTFTRRVRARNVGSPVYFSELLEGIKNTGKRQKYILKVKRLTRELQDVNLFVKDRAVMEAVVEFRDGGPTYQGKALLTFDVAAGEQISGGFPNVKVEVEGRKVYNPATDTTEYTANPAWCVRDLLTNNLYGMGYPAASINDDAFEEWADDCSELILPHTGADEFVGPESTTSITSQLPTVTGVWLGTTYGYFDATVGTVVAGTSVTINWVYNIDSEFGGGTENYQTVHTNTTPQEVVDGLFVTADPTDTYVNGATFRVWVAREERYRLDLVLDQARSAWKWAQDMARTTRAALVQVGSEISVSLGKQKVATAAFSSNGNIKADTLAFAHESKDRRYNVIEVMYPDRDNDYNITSVTVESEGVRSGVEDARKLTLTILGVTRRSQARRMAEFLRRSEAIQRRSVQFEAGLDAVNVMPGDVMKVSNLATYAWSGRILGSTESTVTVDQQIPLETGKQYTYLERQNDGTLSSRVFSVGSDTTTATIPVLRFDANPTGNIYFIGELEQESEKFIVTSFGPVEGTTREIQGVLYSDEVFTDDTEPIPVGTFQGEAADPPDDVTDITVTETVSETLDSSILEIGWTAPVSNVPAVYFVWIKYGPHDWASAGATTTTTLFTEGDWPLGTVLTIAVQGVGSDGGRKAIDDCPSTTYTIQRDGQALVEFPDGVDEDSIVWTPVSGTEYTLSWDAVAGADSYEVRRGGWGAGLVVYEGATNSCTIYVSNMATSYHIRAKKGSVYSPDDAITESATASHVSYPSEVVAVGGGNFDLEVEALTRSTNGSSLEWWLDGQALLQADPLGKLIWETQEADALTSEATHISLDVRAVAYSLLPAESFATFDPRFGGEGDINVRLVDWELLTQYRVTDSDPWSSHSLADNPNADIVLTGRYFRWQFIAEPSLLVTALSDPSRNERRAKTLIERVGIRLYRA